jgi:hypothetical protein
MTAELDALTALLIAEGYPAAREAAGAHVPAVIVALDSADYHVTLDPEGDVGEYILSVFADGVDLLAEERVDLDALMIWLADDPAAR